MFVGCCIFDSSQTREHCFWEDMVAELLSQCRGSLIPPPGETPLHLAARKGQVETLKELLAAGAEKEARNIFGRELRELSDTVAEQEGSVYVAMSQRKAIWNATHLP